MSNAVPDFQSDKEALEFIEEAVATIDTLTKESAELRKENEQLRNEKAALSKQKVVLEKVATSSPFSPDQISEIVDALKPSQFIAETETEKVASILAADPVNVVHLIKKMASSLESHTSGISIPRENDTSSNSADPDGWGNIRLAS